MNKKILLLYGGFSAERNVSINSKHDIATALTKKGYTVIEHNLNNVWDFIETLKNEKPDVVYNGLYGNWGEDGEIQGLLDLLQIPYTHSGLKASAIGMDKYLTKLIAKNIGIKVAEDEKMSIRNFLQNGTKIVYPYVVKPTCDGSSVGVFIVKNDNDKNNIKYDDLDKEVLIEKFIEGQEFTVMCLDGKAHVVTELKTQNQFYDYEAKYTSGFTKHILPAQISNTVAKTCIKYAERLHKALGCNSISRCDFRYNDKDGVVLLEINTNPGMTSLSLAPEQAKYIGISYEDLCEKLINTATYRKK